jgi:S1-C subfamily serine protease
MLFIAVLICQQAEAAPDLAGMQQSTVHIFSLVGNGGASGSGFLVGNGEYAVTNWHVVSLVQKGARLFVISSKQQKTTAQVAWHSAAKDLAILKLDSGSMGRPVSFTPKSGVQVGENVYVMGFPGVVDD